MRFSSLSILAIAAAVPAMSIDAQDAVLLEQIIISGGLTLIEQARYGHAILQMTV